MLLSRNAKNVFIKVYKDREVGKLEMPKVITQELRQINELGPRKVLKMAQVKDAFDALDLDLDRRPRKKRLEVLKFEDEYEKSEDWNDSK